MDVKLDSLIEKIRKEGIEEAQQNADQIIKDAKQKAASLVEQAKEDAEKIIADGKKQVDQYRDTAEIDLKQSARNFELLLKEKLNSLFDNVFKRQVDAELKPNFLKEMILKIIENWAKGTQTEIVLNENDKKQLEDVLFSGIKDDLKKSINLRVSSEIINGFRIGLKGDQVYYDFSDETIAEVLKSLINPKLKEILEK
jgi:V/A-type H+-transporting ATPase subunit E